MLESRGLPRAATVQTERAGISRCQPVRCAEPASYLCAPESAERATVGAFTKLLERPLAYLTDALASHTHQGADPLERHRLGSFLESVVEVQNLLLTGSEILPEHAIDELAHQLVVGAVLDLHAV